MPRAPFNVHVLPYRIEDSSIEYAIFRRSDSSIWQGVAGGGEEGESVLEADKRESFEEALIPQDRPFLKPDSITPIPRYFFADTHSWSEGILVIPQHAFAVDATGLSLRLSSERVEFRWVPFEETHRLLHYHNNKNYLWELNQRLTRRGTGTKRSTGRNSFDPGEQHGSA